jgi:molybdenum cofactor cytidylyltransferase
VTFLACDQPFVDRAHVEMLLMAFRAGCAPIVASGYADGGRPVVGVPALFGRSAFDELRALSGDRAARSVIARDASRVALVPVPAGAIDVDTEEDWRRASMVSP